MNEKKYKYKQFRVNVPSNYTNLIEILESMPAHMRNKAILETLNTGLVLSAKSIQSRITEDAEEYEKRAVDKIAHENQMREKEKEYQAEQNVQILSMLKSMAQEIEDLKKQAAVKDTKNKKIQTEKIEEKEQAEQYVDDVPDVPDDVLAFMNTLYEEG